MVRQKMKSITIFSFAITIITAVLFYYFNRGIYLTLAITFGTVSYHLGIRLLVGFLYDAGMKNQADYTKKWYQIHPWENKLYGFLHVKTCKNKMPTYNSALFSTKKHSWDEIAQAMCQAELIHETNMILSFIPVIASRWFGSFYVFLITSICGAVFDLLFVIIQRYNRARIIKITSRKKKKDNQSYLSES